MQGLPCFSDGSGELGADRQQNPECAAFVRLGADLAFAVMHCDGLLYDCNVRDTYTIDPMTGKGVSADGSAVDLPQTGITSAGSLLTVFAAFLMIAFGALAVCGSGILRRRKDSE